MSRPVKIYISDELAERADQKRGDQSMQDYVLAALRSAVHGSPVEAELRRQVGDLLEILRTLGKPEPPQHRTYHQWDDPLADAQEALRLAQQERNHEQDTRKGW